MPVNAKNKLGLSCFIILNFMATSYAGFIDNGFIAQQGELPAVDKIRTYDYQNRMEYKDTYR